MSSKENDEIYIDASSKTPPSKPDRIQRRAGVWIGLLFCPVGLLLGALFIVEGIEDIRSAIRFANLPQTPGKVIQSSPPPIFATRIPGVYFPYSVDFDYEVDGITYTNTWSKFGLSEKAGRKMLSRYPAGEPVIVAYSPSNPESSFLHPQNAMGLGDFIPFSVGIVGIIFFSFGFYWSIRELRETKKSAGIG